MSSSPFGWRQVTQQQGGLFSPIQNHAIKPLLNQRLHILAVICYQRLLTCCECTFNDTVRSVYLLKIAATGVTFQSTMALCPFLSSTVSVCFPVNPTPFLLYGNIENSRLITSTRVSTEQLDGRTLQSGLTFLTRCRRNESLWMMFAMFCTFSNLETLD